MKRCNSCLARAVAENGDCPVCGIGQEKKKAELSPDEKRVRHFARCILDEWDLEIDLVLHEDGWHGPGGLLLVLA